MYVYKRTEECLWTTGHYAPDGRFMPESDLDNPERAAEQVHYLNGGNASARIHRVGRLTLALRNAAQRLTFLTNWLEREMGECRSVELGRSYVKEAEEALARFA